MVGNLTKADIARELVKVRAGLYQSVRYPLFTAELQQGSGFRHWRMCYDGWPLHDGQASGLDWVVYEIRRRGTCSECGIDSGATKTFGKLFLRTRKGADRHVCATCRDELERLERSIDTAALRAKQAGEAYDLVVAIRSRSTTESAVRLLGFQWPGDL